MSVQIFLFYLGEQTAKLNRVPHILTTMKASEIILEAQKKILLVMCKRLAS